MKVKEDFFSLKKFPSFKIAFAYFLVSLFWIFGSDWLLFQFVGNNSELLLKVGSYKGTAFILLTTLVLYFLLEKREQRIAENRERIEKTEAVSFVMRTLVNLKGNFIKVPLNFCEMLGYTEEELLTKTFQEITYKEDLTENLIFFENALKGSKKTFAFEKRYVAKDGKIIWVYINSSIVEDKSGKPLYWLNYVKNISDRKEIEEKLRQNEEFYRTILENSFDGIMIIDQNGKINYASSSVKVLFGYTPEEMIGNSVLDFVAGEQREISKERLAKIMAGELKITSDLIERKMLCKNGSTTIIESRSADLSKNLIIKGILTNFRDITERKKAEVELQKYYENLETKVKERTRELSERNEELRQEIEKREQAENLLKSKNEELKTFAYTVSHDLKAPLRGISGYAKELTEQHASKINKRGIFCLGQINSATKNLNNLIDSLLDYSRIETRTLNLVEIELDKTVDLVLRERENEITQTKAEILTEIPNAKFKCWEIGVLHIFRNLIGNALKYSSHSKPPKIKIKIEIIEDNCLFMISDNGIGFDMVYHDQIFGLFNRLVRQDEFEGTGAGLAIVKKVVNKLNGKIWAESETGIGSTFFVKIPISK
ncbi:PAS domain S-box protein [bacterium]|nr:PAS domain S-box protein [bacterium]